MLKDGQITKQFYKERKQWHQAQIEEEKSITISEENIQVVQKKRLSNQEIIN